MADTDKTDNATSDYERNIAQEMQDLADKREIVRQKLKDKALDDPVTMQISKETVLDLIPDAALQIRWLINHADSENIRYQLSKWIMELGMKSKDKVDEEDELTALLKDLTKPQSEMGKGEKPADK